MDLIFQQFDGLELSFQCYIPKRILSQLAIAKAQAQQDHGFAAAEFGVNKWPVSVHETGARGGYTYQFNDGPDGGIWLVRDSDNADQYNIRVRVRSLCLALYGYKKTKENILNALINLLGAKGPESNDYIPLERISRVDYCLDFIFAEKFNPSINNFVCAGRTKKSEYIEYPAQLEASGQYVEYVRIGKMPNKQIVIYNKTKEIKAKSKKFWFKIWGIDQNKFSREIWRVEARAGKKELNKWNLRTFSDFENKIGDVIKSILEEFEFRIPNLNDQNINRWKTADFWILAIKKTEIDLNEFISKTERNSILEGIRSEKREQIQKLIAGCFVSLAAIEGKDISEIPAVLDTFNDGLLDAISCNPQKFRQRFEKADARYGFLK